MAKRPEFSFRNTIFIRLIATFLLIMVPVVLLGIYIYHWSIRTASEDISKTAVSQISFYLNDLENEIERMKLLQYGFLEDGDLNKLAIIWETMGDIERMESINSVLDRLITLQNSSNYILDVNVHIRTIAKSISAVKGVKDFDEKRYYVIHDQFRNQTQLTGWEENLLLIAAKPSGSRERDPLFIVEIELDNMKLKEALQQFNIYPNSAAMLISGKTGLVLVSGEGIDRTNGMRELSVKLSRIADGKSVPLELGGRRYFVSHAYSSHLDMSIYRFIPERIVRRPLDKFYIWAWLFAFVSLVIIVVYAFSTYKFIHKPLLKLMRGFRRLESGDLELAIAHNTNDEFRYIYARFNQMVASLRTLIDQVYNQKIMAQRSELKQLQSQINPHFLYNSFFIINTMAKRGDNERIEQFSVQLGEYFQFVTRNASDEVTLKQEIHHARMYTEIQKLRFSRRIEVRFDDLPAAFEQVLVPRLIVQPIIENAFEHSLEKMARNGLISVQFEQRENWACIIVEDNGNGLSDVELERISRLIEHQDDNSETTGMVNIHRRLVITFGEGSGLHVTRGELGGIRVAIRVPLKGD
ncbi:sensor histidine kinase [Paenibacillus vietnamensis]|uniref:sensor histidine kinase n=1 Tax=Paenibacillus vietnamensis TaxID=2590547 RepID=UPI001CD17D2A|nr:histidine kinase [Paenibacillus vietnamensis]